MVAAPQIVYFRDRMATKKNAGGNYTNKNETIRRVYATFLNPDAGPIARFHPLKPILFLSVGITRAMPDAKSVIAETR